MDAATSEKTAYANDGLPTTPEHALLAWLVEIFSSAQGEGLYTGVRQIFLRFFGCHLKCAYCDTPESVTARHPLGFRPGSFRVERTPGRHDFEAVPNPVQAEDLVARVLRLTETTGIHHHSVSLTGGEPLLHALFLGHFLPLLVAAAPLKVYLETAGDLPNALKPLLPYLDIVAMDVKLPSATCDRSRWKKHEEFIRVCRQGRTHLFAKAVVSAATSAVEVERTAHLLSAADPKITLVLQPMTPFGEARNPPSPAQLLDWQALAARWLPDVRIIPQCHKAMGQL